LTRRETARAPIGVFDSGVGGLTVALEIARRLPAERLLYLADQAHVPYGGRPLEEVAGFAERITEHLFAEGAKAVVMACNISSATALEPLRRRFGAARVLGVVQPGARAAIALTEKKTIGVLATAGTVATKAYSRALEHMKPGIEAVEVACPAFVPLVESCDFSGPKAVAAAREYLAQILRSGADCAILGCTHYPFLLPALKQAAPSIRFVDPAIAAAAELELALRREQLLATVEDRDPAEASRFFTTAEERTFREQLRPLFPKEAGAARRLGWDVILASRARRDHEGSCAGGVVGA
jgi:glutamate racemase